MKLQFFCTILAIAIFTGAKAQFITTIAGNTGTGVDSGGFAGDGGLAKLAKLRLPYKICLDPKGNIYFVDAANDRIRKINRAGTISTFAGDGNKGFFGDGGLAINANLESPAGLCADINGNIYFSDAGNNRIRKIDTNGVITTIAGSGAVGFGNGSYSGDGGQAVNSTLNGPLGVFVDTSGNLFIADINNHCIRKVDVNGIITTIAGTGTLGFSGDGGPATAATFAYPGDMIIDGNGNLLIADYENQRIRKVDSNGIITTISGNGYTGYSGDGGPALNATFRYPVDLDLDAAGNLLIADLYNHCIRKIDQAGDISTIIGTPFWGFGGDGGPAISAILQFPNGIAHKDEKIYIVDRLNHRIRMVCNSLVSVSLSASDTIIGCPNHSVSLTASGANTYTYTWSTGQTGISNINVSPSVTAVYYVQARDTNGCIESSFKNLFVNECVGFAKELNHDQTKIYPNPVRSELNITDISFVKPECKISIINSIGQIIKELYLSGNSENKFEIDVSNLKEGMYVIVIDNDSKITSSRFSKID